MCSALLVLVGVLVTAPAQAEGRRVLVLLTAKPPDFWPWLNAELNSAGFATQTLQAKDEPPTRTELEALTRRVSANIGLAPLEQGHGISIWLIDPASHRLSFREVILGLYGPTDPPDVVAVRMVETLRATLIELQKTPGATDELPPPKAAVTPQSHSSRFQLGLGAAGGFSPGGVGPIGLAYASLACALPSRFSLALDAALTPVATRLRATEGTAALSWYLAGATLRFDVTDPRAPLRLRSGVGAWLAHLRTSGQASPPFRGGEGSATSAVPHVDLGLKWAITPRLGLAGDLSAGFGAPGTRIEFAGREIADWGRPLWLGKLLLETSLD